MKNYLDKLNFAETEEQIFGIVRNLPIGHFRSLVKCVGIVIDEFQKMTDVTIEENDNWHKREIPRCKCVTQTMPDPAKANQPPDVDLSNEIQKGGRKTAKCLECGKEIEEGNYCKKHRWGDNEYLPKPNDGEKVTKA